MGWGGFKKIKGGKGFGKGKGKGGIGQGQKANRRPGDEDVAQEDKYGVHVMEDGESLEGYLFNMKNTTQHNEDDGRTLAGLLLYFVEAKQEGVEKPRTFRATYLYRPYMYVDFVEGAPTRQLMEIVDDRFKEFNCKSEIVEKEDLQMEDHLAGKKHPMLKLSFDNMDGMMSARRDLTTVIKRNETKFKDDEYDLDGEQTGRKEVFEK